MDLEMTLQVNGTRRRTQPVQIVAGSVAGRKWMSDDLYKRAASTKKNFHVVEGSNHMQLYDVPKSVDEAVSVLAPFFKSTLSTLVRSQEVKSWAEYPKKEWQKRRSN